MKNREQNRPITEDESLIKHDGVVSKITSDTITIALEGNINCEGCKAKSACGIADSGSKEVEIPFNAQDVQINESISVILSKQLGMKAVFWAYLFPFILLMTVLLISSNVFPEWLAGLLSISVLVPYYTMLYLNKKKFKKAFKLSIKKHF